jgi:hypothetical protein
VHTGAQTSASLRLPTDVELVAVDENDREAVFVVDTAASIDLASLSFQQTTTARGETEGPQKGWLQRPFTPDFFHGWAQRDSHAPQTPNGASSSVASRVAAGDDTKAPAALLRTDDAPEFPVVAVGSLAAISAGAAALTVVSGLWMASAAQTYNQTDLEVPAADAAAEYSAAATSVVVLGTASIVAATAAAIWWWTATRAP